MRGDKVGKSTLSDPFQSNGHVVELPLPLCLPVGAELMTKPNGSKTVKGQRSGPFTAIVGSTTAYSLLARLPQYLEHKFRVSTCLSGFLFGLLPADSISAAKASCCSLIS